MTKFSLLMLSTCILLAASPVLAQESTAPSAATPVQPSPSELAAEIASLDKEIAAAESDASSYDEGLIQGMVKFRLETLRLTRAVLQNRMAAQEGGATVEITVLGGQPDKELADRILSEIEAQNKVIEEAKQEVKKTGGAGLIGTLAVSRLETEKMNLAVLRASWYRAAYGVIAPALTAAETPSVAAAAPAADSEGQRSSSDAAKSTVEWADPNHPDIDYSRPIFAQLNKEAFRLSGWWGISETKAAIDDTVQIFAINVSQYGDGFQLNNPKLTVGCREGTASVIYDTEDYLLTDYQSNTIPVTWRIDDRDAVNDRWSKVTSNTAAGQFDQQGVKMIRELYDAKKLFVRIVEKNGKQHDATFDMAGSQAAFDGVAAACGFTTIKLGPDEYRSIQTLLNAGGFDAGTPDGQWGTGSQNALRAFQASVGLPETGAPDRATLDKLGLAN